jgi:hypothetical protein
MHVTTGRPEATSVAEQVPVTAGVGDNAMIWVETTDGRAPLLYIVDRRRFTDEQFAELEAQARDWAERLNRTSGRLRVI